MSFSTSKFLRKKEEVLQSEVNRLRGVVNSIWQSYSSSSGDSGSSAELDLSTSSALNNIKPLVIISTSSDDEGSSSSSEGGTHPLNSSFMAALNELKTYLYDLEVVQRERNFFDNVILIGCDCYNIQDTNTLNRRDKLMKFFYNDKGEKIFIKFFTYEEYEAYAKLLEMNSYLNEVNNLTNKDDGR